ncbi:hypothetical protein ACQCVP_11930 [Rossellomorea vietnamensis]|uniref:hypothetical protein n=1 Tax=Rossellomorea vietnamensis TaxID=218284 RepID=UPI003CF3D42E
MNIQRDSKKITLKFAIKAGADKKTQELYKFAGRNVNLKVQASQLSIDEFYEEHEGIEYSVDGEGNVEVPKEQLSMDDVTEEDEKKDEEEKDPFEEQELH